jgi:hypothetical protein
VIVVEVFDGWTIPLKGEFGDRHFFRLCGHRFSLVAPSFNFFLSLFRNFLAALRYIPGRNLVPMQHNATDEINSNGISLARGRHQDNVDAMDAKNAKDAKSTSTAKPLAATPNHGSSIDLRKHPPSLPPNIKAEYVNEGAANVVYRFSLPKQANGSSTSSPMLEVLDSLDPYWNGTLTFYFLSIFPLYLAAEFV